MVGLVSEFVGGFEFIGVDEVVVDPVAGSDGGEVGALLAIEVIGDGVDLGGGADVCSKVSKGGDEFGASKAKSRESNRKF